MWGGLKRGGEGRGGEEDRMGHGGYACNGF